MPSTYAHYRMGQEVRNKGSEKMRAIIGAFPELYMIGLHGPDILFYYKPLSLNPINQVGYGMHARPGKEFFQIAADNIKNHSYEPEYLAYTYGFICHFALDVTCHGYIDEKIAASGVSHTEIEVEFDRSLMLQDGLDPITQQLTDHIIASEQNARIINTFYLGLNKEEVLKALRSMKSYNRLLVAPSPVKRSMITLLLKASGNYKEMHGLVVNYEKNPACDDSTEHLMELYEQARDLAIQLIEEFDAYLSGVKELNPIYEYTFGTQLIKEEMAG